MHRVQQTAAASMEEGERSVVGKYQSWQRHGVFRRPSARRWLKVCTKRRFIKRQRHGTGWDGEGATSTTSDVSCVMQWRLLTHSLQDTQANDSAELQQEMVHTTKEQAQAGFEMKAVYPGQRKGGMRYAGHKKKVWKKARHSARVSCR